MKIVLKIIVALVLIAVLILGYFYTQYKPHPDPQFGVSFSIPQIEYLGFEWKTVYLDMLNDLKPKKLRLMAYWEAIEPQRRVYDFQDTAEMVLEAQKRNIDVILVVGVKQPRWPECHKPAWYDELSAEEQGAALLEYVENTVNYFRQFDAIKIWQVENEPFFAFGYECEKLPADLVKQEIEKVRSLDSRPIMLTDSGEQGYWVSTARLGPDIFGSTMYRTVYSSKFGYYQYPLPPQYFRIKAGWLNSNSEVSKIIGVELQAEPWFVDDISHTPLETQYSLMNPKVFENHVEYARKVGFEENYLWGVEWWYWLAQKQGDWGMWEAAKQVLAQ